MNRKLQILTVALLSSISTIGWAQEIKTIFNDSKDSQRPTGYGAITNQFTMIRGQYANMVGAYGGVYLNNRFLLGFGGSGVTNNIPVPAEFSADPSRNLSYMYGQFGLVTEWVVASDKAFHVAFNMFAGPGFTVQYERYGYRDYNFSDKGYRDENWFLVAEPGVQLEINLLKWMRFSPGVSYRAAFGSKAGGMTDSDISNVSYNATLKFGKF